MITKLDIQNAALGRVGQEPILSEDDDSTRARAVKAEYALCLENLTRSHPWRHATAYTGLNLVTPKPADVFDFPFVFQLPQDCTRVISTSLDQMALWTEIENRRIACHSSTLSVKFIRLVEDVSKMGANFRDVLAWMIARNVGPLLTASTERMKICAEMYQSELELARSFDAQIGMLDRVASPTFPRNRRY